MGSELVLILNVSGTASLSAQLQRILGTDFTVVADRIRSHEHATSSDLVESLGKVVQSHDPYLIFLVSQRQALDVASEFLVALSRSAEGVPVIAAVEGFAMGGGCERAVRSDFVGAADTAVFAVPEVTRGIFPGIGGTQLLPRILGAPLAKEMIFTGRRVAAQEAKAVGLVNHLVPAGQARAKALEIAATIAENGPFAVRQAKKAIAWGSETDLETALRLAIEAYNNTVTTEDRLEGVRAFNEKRTPRFTGR